MRILRIRYATHVSHRRGITKLGDRERAREREKERERRERREERKRVM